MRYLIQLNFDSGVHFGADEAGIDREEVNGTAHADTLFSALINALASIKIEFKNRDWVEQLLYNSADDKTTLLPFRLSSFGIVDLNEIPVYYLPKPLSSPMDLISKEQQVKYGKEFNRRKFISHDTFKKWQLGETLNLNRIINQERETFWATDYRIQHLTDSLTLETQIYRTGITFYHENVNPFFIVDLNESKLTIDEFLKLLHVLKRNGLGGRRTSGNGLFDFSDEEWFCIDEPDSENDELAEAKAVLHDILNFESNTKYLFSLYYPSDFNRTKPVAYDLVQRKGWIYSSSSFNQLKRKTCYMFSEGSIFSSLSEGKLVDVTPAEFKEHRVYRYGLPFTIPFREVTS